MHIYTLRHCMFFAYPFAFSVPAIFSPVVAPRLAIAPRRRSAAFVSEPRIAARLAVFVGARLHSVFRDSASRLLFSRSLFASCPCHTANFLFVFSDFGFSRFPFEDPLRIFARL